MISNRCARKSLVTNCNSIISKNYLRFLVDSNDKKYLIKFIPRSMYNASEFLWAFSIFAIQHRKFNNKLKGELGILMAFHSACRFLFYIEPTIHRTFFNVRFVFDRILPIDHHFSIQQNVPIQVKAKNPTPIIGMEFKSLVRY